MILTFTVWPPQSANTGGAWEVSRNNTKNPIKKVIDSFDFEWLRTRAETLRRKPCHEIRKDAFSAGQDFIVFELSFTDEASWVTCIPKPRFDEPAFESCKGQAELLTEIQILISVGKNSSIAVPAVIDYNLELPCQLGASYIIMEGIVVGVFGYR
jgi:hypothetical protein